MSSSIGTQSIYNPSIFSLSDSYLSADTQWTSESSINFDQKTDRRGKDGQRKHSRQMGRPPINWTRTRLRKLTRLYLLTDLELEGIIKLLHTDDFQPCKRNVQEKLTLLLQPQPNKIRLKGDTTVLRKLLFECRRLQRARRVRAQQHRCRVGQKYRSLERDGNTTTPFANCGVVSLSTENGTLRTETLDTADVTLNSLGSSDYEGGFPSTQSFALDDPTPFFPKESSEGRSALTSTDGFDWQTTQEDIDLTSLLDWPTGLGVQPQRLYNTTLKEDYCNSICYQSDVTSLHDHVRDLANPSPDFGFDSEFGLKSVLPVPQSLPMLSTFQSGDKIIPAAEIDNNETCPNTPQTCQTFAPFNFYPAASRRYPTVNSTYVRDNLDNDSNMVLEINSCYDLDIVEDPVQEIGPSQQSIGNVDHPNQAECFSLRNSPGGLPEPPAATGSQIISRPSSSSSRISVLLSRMSLSPLSSSLDLRQSLISASEDEMDAHTPLVLPGVFPEYCWQHINQNKLRRCSQWDGIQKCNSKRPLKKGPTHRSLHADILSRILQRNIRATDIDEMDAFGNSILHISATMLAPPSYLISLIKLGANVNSLNNAGQTFLHLVKPEVLIPCEDFCYLLELLTTRGFNFGQHDHLGQSPLHLLMRPWICPDLLRKIITKLDSLPVHSQISSARDYLGYTVVGQMNLHGTETSHIELDQAILSLACETEKPIVDPRDLQVPTLRSWRQNSICKDDQLARNYENHPSIQTVDDLLRYEQHVDYWRTIVAARASPWFEDSNGRNGLHCLAEASLSSREMPLPSTLLDELSSLKETERTDKESDRECFIKCLLQVGVDPNNYDSEGNTPLMAFVTHNRVDEGDDCTTRILGYLLEAGSDICRRNRRGETALHLAVKFGHTAATKVLLASGANIHARTSSGLGVLELGHMHSMKSKQDENLYAQIMLCMSLAASFGAVSEPTILDELSSPQWGFTTENHTERKGFKMVKNFITSKIQGRRRRKSYQTQARAK